MWVGPDQTKKVFSMVPFKVHFQLIWLLLDITPKSTSASLLHLSLYIFENLRFIFWIDKMPEMLPRWRFVLYESFLVTNTTYLLSLKVLIVNVAFADCLSI